MNTALELILQNIAPMRIQGQVVCFCAITLENRGQRLAGVHDSQETGVVGSVLGTCWAMASRWRQTDI